MRQNFVNQSCLRCWSRDHSTIPFCVVSIPFWLCSAVFPDFRLCFWNHLPAFCTCRSDPAAVKRFVQDDCVLLPVLSLCWRFLSSLHPEGQKPHFSTRKQRNWLLSHIVFLQTGNRFFETGKTAATDQHTFLLTSCASLSSSSCMTRTFAFRKRICASEPISAANRTDKNTSKDAAVDLNLSDNRMCAILWCKCQEWITGTWQTWKNNNKTIVSYNLQTISQRLPQSYPPRICNQSWNQSRNKKVENALFAFWKFLNMINPQTNTIKVVIKTLPNYH